MDPLTQGALGAALAQTTPTKTKNLVIAGGLGFASGMAADLDVLIRSSTDPFLFLEYHRHFTHSLSFIPIGGLLCALAIHWLVGQRWKLTFSQTLVCCVLGYGTHALLDASTSYGTMLFWPFSDERVAWSIIPVIDPLFTLPLVALCVLSAVKKKRILAGIGLCWASLYIGLGAVQHTTAVSFGKQIAESRGHSPVRIEAKPSFANILVWKTIYESNNTFYVDAVRVGIGPQAFDGVSIPKLKVERDLPWLDAESQQAKDIQRFRRFSNDFVSLAPTDTNRVVDIRYSFVPNEITPLWSVNISPMAGSNEHARYLTHREDPKESLERLLQLIFKSE